MADQNITELPIKTNSGVASTDYMLGIDSAEGYQILVRDVAKYIVENYNGSTILGSAQPVKDAVNILDDMSYKTLFDYNNMDIIPYITALRKGTYFVRIDNVTGFPVTGGVVYRITKVNVAGDTRCSILAIPMNANSPDVYTAFVPQNATSITWKKMAKQDDVDALNSNLTGKSLPIKMRIVCNNASTDTVHTLGYVTANYGSFLIALRTDTAADGTWFGLVRHNSAGWQISEIYKGSTVYTPYVDTDGSIKTSSANNSMVHGMLIALATWN